VRQEAATKVRVKWVFGLTLVLLALALIGAGLWYLAVLALIGAAGWPISERYSREYEHRIDPTADEVEPGSPFNRHLP
jgi:hypothetical protein